MDKAMFDQIIKEIDEGTAPIIIPDAIRIVKADRGVIFALSPTKHDDNTILNAARAEGLNCVMWQFGNKENPYFDEPEGWHWIMKVKK